MKLKQWMKVILVGGAVLMLAACSSGRKPHDTSAVDDANSAYSDAEAAGLGDDSNFNDRAGGTKSASNRVYYFDYDSNVVRDEDKPAINANANKLAANHNSKVLLEGHTDPRGSREYNIGLGERRAKSVAEEMTQKGVNPSQVRIVSYGAEKLASSGRSESDYQQDRRAVLVYLKQ